MTVRPYTFGTNSLANAQLQRALAAAALEYGKPEFDAGAADGDFGRQTQAAVKAVQTYLGTVADGFVRDDVLMFLGLKSAPKAISIFDQLGTLLSLVQLLKGKTMTSDQITGVLRALIAALSGFFIAKGWGTADFWTWIGAGVTGVVPIVWTWINNRPKVISPIGQ